jgi:hypothetical protein
MGEIFNLNYPDDSRLECGLQKLGFRHAVRNSLVSTVVLELGE